MEGKTLARQDTEKAKAHGRQGTGLPRHWVGKALNKLDTGQARHMEDKILDWQDRQGNE